MSEAVTTTIACSCCAGKKCVYRWVRVWDCSNSVWGTATLTKTCTAAASLPTEGLDGWSIVNFTATYIHIGSGCSVDGDCATVTAPSAPTEDLSSLCDCLNTCSVQITLAGITLCSGCRSNFGCESDGGSSSCGALDITGDPNGTYCIPAFGVGYQDGPLLYRIHAPGGFSGCSYPENNACHGPVVQTTRPFSIVVCIKPTIGTIDHYTITLNVLGGSSSPCSYPQQNAIFTGQISVPIASLNSEDGCSVTIDGYVQDCARIWSPDCCGVYDPGNGIPIQKEPPCTPYYDRAWDDPIGGTGGTATVVFGNPCPCPQRKCIYLWQCVWSCLTQSSGSVSLVSKQCGDAFQSTDTDWFLESDSLIDKTRTYNKFTYGADCTSSPDECADVAAPSAPDPINCKLCHTTLYALWDCYHPELGWQEQPDATQIECIDDDGSLDIDWFFWSRDGTHNLVYYRKDIYTFAFCDTGPCEAATSALPVDPPVECCTQTKSIICDHLTIGGHNYICERELTCLGLSGPLSNGFYQFDCDGHTICIIVEAAYPVGDCVAALGASICNICNGTVYRITIAECPL